MLKLLNCEVSNKRPSVMIPIPQYPLYSATLAEFNMGQVGYYLDECRNWGLTVSELEVMKTGSNLRELTDGNVRL